MQLRELSIQLLALLQEAEDRQLGVECSDRVDDVAHEQAEGGLALCVVLVFSYRWGSIPKKQAPFSRLSQMSAEHLRLAAEL